MSKLELTMNVKPSKYLQASHWRNQIWNSWGKSLHSRTAGFLPLLAETVGWWHKANNMEQRLGAMTSRSESR